MSAGGGGIPVHLRYTVSHALGNNMPTSVRLDPKTEGLIRRLAKQRGQTKSELIRAAIAALARRATAVEARTGRLRPYDPVAHVCGSADRGCARPSQRTGERVPARV